MVDFSIRLVSDNKIRGSYLLFEINTLLVISLQRNCCANRARQLHKNISMLFRFPVTRDLLFTNIHTEP